ncbi:hypothetical protein WH96_05700 [Kiloniella spongiae]|uniref:HTH luxR-type domain-containing protein n=1 Tax=Kiloniella spongiae TaxID=1489064 RepID=A0A0H2MHV7_9PROT|nr:hypothetical protein [Kiloniella spongiae]KLN61786.1 hypothetical protein WH96_05700 [Kiloniella spongiae]
MKELKFVQDILQAETPGETSDLILNVGFNGLFFQRWYPDIMDNWEGHLAEGFQEHYYAAQIYRFCPVARAIHQWHRNYTFAEARRSILVGNEQAKLADSLWKFFGMEDGVVVFSGRCNLKSALILTTDRPVEELYQKYSGVLALAADKLDKQLYPGHTLLRQLSRENITLSPIQQKILKLQINQPELSNAAMAEMLGISVNTLFSHHKKIAKKEGVTTFTGAIIKQLHKNTSD